MSPGWKLGDLLFSVSSSVNSLELSEEEKIAFGSTKLLSAWQLYHDHHWGFCLFLSIVLTFILHNKCRVSLFIDRLLCWSWVEQQRLLNLLCSLYTSLSVHHHPLATLGPVSLSLMAHYFWPGLHSKTAFDTLPSNPQGSGVTFQFLPLLISCHQGELIILLHF